jgi:hypothetical protein
MASESMNVGNRMKSNSEVVNFIVAFFLFYTLAATLSFLAIPAVVGTESYQCLSSGSITCVEMVLSEPILILILIISFSIGMTYYKIKERPDLHKLSTIAIAQVAAFVILTVIEIELAKILLSTIMS